MFIIKNFIDFMNPQGFIVMATTEQPKNDEKELQKILNLSDEYFEKMKENANLLIRYMKNYMDKLSSLYNKNIIETFITDKKEEEKKENITIILPERRHEINSQNFVKSLLKRNDMILFLASIFPHNVMDNFTAEKEIDEKKARRKNENKLTYNQEIAKHLEQSIFKHNNIFKNDLFRLILVDPINNYYQENKNSSFILHLLLMMGIVNSIPVNSTFIASDQELGKVLEKFYKDDAILGNFKKLYMLSILSILIDYYNQNSGIHHHAKIGIIKLTQDIMNILEIIENTKTSCCNEQDNENTDNQINIENAENNIDNNIDNEQNENKKETNKNENNIQNVNERLEEYIYKTITMKKFSDLSKYFDTKTKDQLPLKLQTDKIDNNNITEELNKLKTELIDNLKTLKHIDKNDQKNSILHFLKKYVISKNDDKSNNNNDQNSENDNKNNKPMVFVEKGITKNLKNQIENQEIKYFNSPRILYLKNYQHHFVISEVSEDVQNTKTIINFKDMFIDGDEKKRKENETRLANAITNKFIVHSKTYNNKMNKNDKDEKRNIKKKEGKNIVMVYINYDISNEPIKYTINKNMFTVEKGFFAKLCGLLCKCQMNKFEKYKEENDNKLKLFNGKDLLLKTSVPSAYVELIEKDFNNDNNDMEDLYINLLKIIIDGKRAMMEQYEIENTGMDLSDIFKKTSEHIEYEYSISHYHNINQNNNTTGKVEHNETFNKYN